MNKKYNDISDFFIIIKNNYKLFIFSLIFFFLLSSYISFNQFINEKKINVIEIDLSDILLQTHKKINKLKDLLPFSNQTSYSFELPRNEDILEVLTYGITLDLNENDDLDLEDISSELYTEITDSFTKIEKIKLIIKFNYYDELNISKKNNIESTINHNLNKTFKIIKNNLNSQIITINEKIIYSLDKQLKDKEIELRLNKKQFISNINSYLSMNLVSNKNNDSLVTTELSDKNTNEILNFKEILLMSNSKWTTLLNSINIFAINKPYFNLFDNSIGNEITTIELHIEVLKEKKFEVAKNLPLITAKFFTDYDDYYNFDYINLPILYQKIINNYGRNAILTFSAIMTSGIIIVLFIIFLAEGLRKNYKK